MAGGRTANPPAKGLHPMKFPTDDVIIPVTEKELRAQGVKFCLHKVLAQNQCLVKAKNEYLKQGNDPAKGPQWYYFHLRMCIETHKSANQCVIDHREQELRERHKRIREKKLGLIRLDTLLLQFYANKLQDVLHQCRVKSYPPNRRQ